MFGGALNYTSFSLTVLRLHEEDVKILEAIWCRGVIFRYDSNIRKNIIKVTVIPEKKFLKR